MNEKVCEEMFGINNVSNFYGRVRIITDINVDLRGGKESN